VRGFERTSGLTFAASRPSHSKTCPLKPWEAATVAY
jgi:hypothetical protein